MKLTRRRKTRHFGRGAAIWNWALVLVAVPLLVIILGCQEEPPNVPANLVVVCLDTVRNDTFHLPEKVHRPDHLSAWLESALIFSKTQSTSPWTVPSIASVFTGLYPSVHRAGEFASSIANLGKEIPSTLSEESSTLAETLERAGFRTGAFVAHPWFTSGYGLDRGFETVVLQKGSKSLVSEALRWIDDRPDESAPTGDAQKSRFFLYLHFMEAHDRHQRPITEIRDELAGDPLVGSAESEFSPANVCELKSDKTCDRYRVYARAVRQLRHTVADLMDELAARELISDTIVVVFSDHGEEFSDHREVEEEMASDPRGFYGVGHGHQLFQELLHVPFLIWHPEMAGRTVRSRTSLVDAVPSLLDWLQIPDNLHPGNEKLAGKRYGSLDVEGEWTEERSIFSSGIAYGPEGTAIIRGQWKSIRMAAGQHPMLFDLESDPGEKSIHHRIDVEEALGQELDRYATQSGRGDTSAAEISKDQLERLKAIGYLGGSGGG